MAQIGGHSINSSEVIHFKIARKSFARVSRLNRVEIDSLFSYSPVDKYYSVESRTIPKPSL